MYRSSLSLKNSQYDSYEVDAEGSAFQYNVNTTNYKEEHRTYSVNIPVMLQYHTNGNTQWYVNAGGKVFIPLSTSVKASADRLITSGFFPDYNIEVSDLPEHGFGTVNNWKDGNNFQLSPAIFASAATGLSFKLSGNLRLYTGVYVDYGVTDIRKKDNNQGLVSYSPSNVNAIRANSIMTTPHVSNVKLAGYGVQLRLNFGKRKKERDIPHTGHAHPHAVDTAKKEIPARDTTKAPLPAPEKRIAKPSIDEETTIKQPIAFGEIGRTAEPEEWKQHVDSVAAILLKYPDIQLEITGHTCDIGTDDTNQRVGEARARATAVYLEKKGVSSSRINISSAGNTQPIGNRRQNRRVTIVIM